MHYRILRSVLTVIILSVFLTLSSSCEKNTTDVSDLSPTPAVFENPDQNEALYSGNLLYGQTLASDGKYLFFISKDGSQLLKTPFGGGQINVLSEKAPSGISYMNKYLFFISGGSGGPIYKVDTDGNGETMITDRTASQIVASPMNIYFISANNGLLYSIEHDGSNLTLIYPEKVLRIMRYSENLYLIPADAPDTVLIMNKARITSVISGDDPSGSPLPAYDLGMLALSVNVTRDKVYFTDPEYNGIYTVAFGGKPQRISLLKLDSPFILDSSYIYFVDPQNERRLYRFHSDRPDTIELVVNDAVKGFAVIGNSIFYYRESGSSVYRVSVGGGISEKVS